VEATRGHRIHWRLVVESEISGGFFEHFSLNDMIWCILRDNASSKFMDVRG